MPAELLQLADALGVVVEPPLRDHQPPFVAGVAFGVAEQPRVERVHAAVQRPDFHEDLLDVLVHGLIVAPWCGCAHGSDFIARNRQIANTVFRATTSTRSVGLVGNRLSMRVSRRTFLG